MCLFKPVTALSSTAKFIILFLSECADTKQFKISAGSYFSLHPYTQEEKKTFRKGKCKKILGLHSLRKASLGFIRSDNLS